ncbi:ead/Ea22-like family protein [Enterobacter cloacae complex sp. IR5459]|uniref:ead/Ea22-like family protein n=1 Tax=Enterobacter cloacae complex sp. IR5459 TaxID=3412376 RepID=UPI003BA355C1
MSNIDKQALNQEKIEWLNKLADMEYCKSNPGHWLMSLKDTNMLAKLALRSVALLDELEAKDKSIDFLKDQLAQLANFNPDWDKLEAATDSLREHMAELTAARKRIAELEGREVVLPSAHDVHPLGPQSAKIFCEFHRSIVNRCADEISKVGVKVSIKGN